MELVVAPSAGCRPIPNPTFVREDWSARAAERVTESEFAVHSLEELWIELLHCKTGECRA
jgi:hypothetical protein